MPESQGLGIWAIRESLSIEKSLFPLSLRLAVRAGGPLAVLREGMSTPRQLYFMAATLRPGDQFEFWPPPSLSHLPRRQPSASAKAASAPHHPHVGGAPAFEAPLALNAYLWCRRSLFRYGMPFCQKSRLTRGSRWLALAPFWRGESKNPLISRGYERWLKLSVSIWEPPTAWSR